MALQSQGVFGEVELLSVAQPLTFRVVCHSDLHFARNEWGFTQFQAVPGHEIVGSVVMTYGSMDKHLNTPTYGGYSQGIVVTEEFVLRIPPNLHLAAAAPLLCAGITTYSPLRRWKVGTGQKVGIIGLGGLGHMAVKFAHAFGAHVVRRLIPMRRAVNGRLRSAQARPSNGNMRSRARGFFG